MVSEMTFLLTDSCQAKAYLTKHKLVFALQNIVGGDVDLSKGFIWFYFKQLFWDWLI
jgi:hypothetical protein